VEGLPDRSADDAHDAKPSAATSDDARADDSLPLNTNQAAEILAADIVAADFVTTVESTTSADDSAASIHSASLNAAIPDPPLELQISDDPL